MLDRTTGYGDMEEEGGFGGSGYGFMNAELEDLELDEVEAGDPFGSDGYDSFGLGEAAYESGEAWGEGGDFEGDEFSFGSLLKKAGSLAKRFAPQIGSVIGGALGGPAGAAIGGRLGSVVKQLEADDEGDSEEELNATMDVPSTEDQLAESVAVAAGRGRPIDAQSMGSLITIFIGHRAPLPVKTVLPVLGQASGNVARMLVQSRDPRARALIRTLPTIQRRTLATLTAKARNGKPITPKVALRVMAKQANRTLNNPSAVGRALASNAAKKRALDRRAIRGAERFY